MWLDQKIAIALLATITLSACLSDGQQQEDAQTLSSAQEVGNNNQYDDDWNDISNQQQADQNLAQQNVQEAANAEGEDQTDQFDQFAQQDQMQWDNNFNESQFAANFGEGDELLGQTQDANSLAATNAMPPMMNVAPAAAEPPLDSEPAPVVPSVTDGTQDAIEGALLLANEVLPASAELYWVGYDYVERDALVRLEIVTRGKPKFDLFQETNKSGQPELVVRFFQTNLRSKLRRDIDASEFRSPIAFVRMRPDAFENHVDVVITMRDVVQPRMYAKNGNVMLTFPIPDHYFGNSTIGSAPIAQAQTLPNSSVLPELEQTSEMPEGLKIARAFTHNPGEQAFATAPADGGALVMPEPVAQSLPSGEGLPSDFSNALPPPQTNGSSILPVGGAMAPASNVAPQANMAPIAGGPQPAQGNTGNWNFEDNFNNANTNQFDDIDFGGGEPAAQQVGADQQGRASGQGNQDKQGKQGSQGSQGNEDWQDSDNDDGFEDENNEELWDDDLEDFDDGEGESSGDIDKFDVRRRTPAAALWAASYAITQFSLAGVGQDDQFMNAGMSDDLGAEFSADAMANGVATNPTGGGNSFATDAAAVDQGAFTGDVGAATAAPADAFSGNSFGSNMATGAQPYNAAALPGEAALEAGVDLAGEEQVGLDADAPPQQSAGGRPVKLDFREAPLKEVIRALGEESGVNFIYPSELGSKSVSLNLSGVPFNDALQAVLQTNRLGMVEVGPNVIRIDTLDNIAKDKQALEERRRAELNLLPTKIYVHRLSYAKAAEAQALLNSMLQSTGDKRISVQTDNRTNSVIVHGPATHFPMVKALLERIDLETPQVKIASRIVEVFKNFTDNFGVSWGTPLNVDPGRGLGFGTLPFPNYMLSRYSIDAGGRNSAPGRFDFTFGSINNLVSLDLALSMEETRNTVEVLQSSNVIVQDNTQAVIVAGSSDFFRPPAALTAEAASDQNLVSVEYNLNMTVTPHITADGAVQMQLDITSDSPKNPSAGSSGAAAGRDNRSIKTSLLRRSGETAVIGGVYTSQKEKTDTGVPFLSSLPIIGALFRTSTDMDQKKELMVMLTPTIVSAGKNGASAPGVASNLPVENFNANSGGFESNSWNNGNSTNEQNSGSQNFNSQNDFGNQQGVQNYSNQQNFNMQENFGGEQVNDWQNQQGWDDFQQNQQGQQGQQGQDSQQGMNPVDQQFQQQNFDEF